MRQTYKPRQCKMSERLTHTDEGKHFKALPHDNFCQPLSIFFTHAAVSFVELLIAKAHSAVEIAHRVNPTYGFFSIVPFIFYQYPFEVPINLDKSSAK